MSWKSEVWFALGECCFYLISIIWALLVRLILILHTYVSLWKVVTQTNDEQYWYLLGLVSIQLGELIYRVAVCKGNEGMWVCPCFFFYLLSTVPSIWILELDRLEQYDLISQNVTASGVALSSVQGISIPIKLSADVWVSVIEQSLLFLLILCRWILPRGEITRDQLSQLLFVYIGMASDIMELFVLFDEQTVRNDRVLVYIILVVWSISLLQFCLVLTATRNPKKARVATVHPTESSAPTKGKKKKDVLIMCLTTEVWSLLVTFLMQDGPFLCVRLYALIRYTLITYNILFFTCKNLLVVMLLTYRLIVLCCQNDENEKDDDEEIIIGQQEKKDAVEAADYDNEKPTNGNFVSVMNVN
ncbi:transmembrane protein 26 isoform X1 [Patella vulgata]|uniref:transmembrane protein 26 isoform X1 n=1 Tax=Patella vulgata TaxID=6465 RepID=UPI0021804613|nr:transmembrane protein 26 isoform X1 [Patella vulgata]